MAETSHDQMTKVRQKPSLIILVAVPQSCVRSRTVELLANYSNRMCMGVCVSPSLEARV